MPQVTNLDHLVLTVADLAESIRFYSMVLGMKPVCFAAADGSPRHALRFGTQKINLHQSGDAIAPVAAQPTTGSADLCFVSESPLSDWQARLADLGIPIVEGPVSRQGARGPIRSIYIRDPDGNLIEVSVYQ